MPATEFEEIFAAGLTAVRTGSHAVEGDPKVTGRWGPSIVLLPTGDAARCLAGLAATAAEIAGGRHWLSGGLGRAHLTVRALERYTASVDPERLQRYRAALDRTLRQVDVLRFEFRGLGISRGSVMACAAPLNPSVDALRERLGAELGPDGWLEDRFFDNGRAPIWYCSILHYAAPLTNADQLIDWVHSYRDVPLVEHTFTSVDICSWEFDGEGMAPHVAASVPVGKAG